jgi:hypothetical protein
MAWLDLQQVTELKQRLGDPRLNDFHQTTMITIIIELIGFYCQSFSLGWGSIIILISQFWFNLQIKIKLEPNTKPYLQDSTIQQRLPVLFANSLGLILISFWLNNLAKLGIALGLLSIVIIYGIIKYGSLLVKTSQTD